MARANHPKNVAKYQDSEQFSGRPEVTNPKDRADHHDAVDPGEFAESTAHENERNISQPRKGPERVRPEQDVTTSKTRKTDEGVGGL